MQDIEDQQLKAELDAIMDHVETIMSRIESVMPGIEDKNEQHED